MSATTLPASPPPATPRRRSKDVMVRETRHTAVAGAPALPLCNLETVLNRLRVEFVDTDWAEAALRRGESVESTHASFSVVADHVEGPALPVAATLQDVMVAELTKQRDTMADLHLALRLLGHPMLSKACAIARDSANATLGLAGGK